MNISLWFSQNKIASCIAIIFVLGAAILGYLAWSAWDTYGLVTAEYSSKASQLDKLAHNAIFPTASNLKKLTQTLNQNQADLNKLQDALHVYSIAAFGDFDKTKPQDQPQYFQDTLRTQVTAIKSLATTSGSTLPPSFYLGLDEYENRLPLPEQLPLLSKQLTVLNWLATSVVDLKGVTVAEFSRVASDAGKLSLTRKQTVSPSKTGLSSQLPYVSMGSMRITLRCSQGAFRDLINLLSSAPYFLIIEDMKVQNSVGEPPRRDVAPSADQPPDGSTTSQRLPIIVGRESLNIFLKIRMIDFPAIQNQPETSK